ncbi:MAG: hypothetical protein FWE68_01930 [Defluviitaleaceae bacterium]|nr:hypothetical protein [Defluviitaleaceae bacterium]
MTKEAGVTVRTQKTYKEFVSYYTATAEAYTLDGENRLRPAARDEGPMQPRKPHLYDHVLPERQERSPRGDDQIHLAGKEPFIKEKKRKKPPEAWRRIQRTKVVYVDILANTQFFTWRLLVSLAAIFVGMIAITISSAILRQEFAGLNALRNEIALLQEEEASLRARIAEDYDVVQIERIATTRLNMSQPRAHQIVYITMPRQDYVVQHGILDEFEDRPSSLMEAISGLLNQAGTSLFSLLPG